MLYTSRNRKRACTLGVHEELFGQVSELSVLSDALSSAKIIWFFRRSAKGLLREAQEVQDLSRKR